VETASLKEMMLRLDGKSFFDLPEWKRELFWGTLTYGLAHKVNRLRLEQERSVRHFAAHVIDTVVSNVNQPRLKRPMLESMEKLGQIAPEAFSYRLDKLTALLNDSGRQNRRNLNLILLNEWSQELDSMLWYINRRGFQTGASSKEAAQLGLSGSTLFLRSSLQALPHAVQIQGRYKEAFGSDADIEQLTRMARAVSSNKLSGATYEIAGRVSPQFISWLKKNRKPTDIPSCSGSTRPEPLTPLRSSRLKNLFPNSRKLFHRMRSSPSFSSGARLSGEHSEISQNGGKDRPYHYRSALASSILSC
jgi:hypothetical protein